MQDNQTQEQPILTWKDIPADTLKTIWIMQKISRYTNNDRQKQFVANDIYTEAQHITAKVSLRA